jgi:hypothetical protein
MKRFLAASLAAAGLSLAFAGGAPAKPTASCTTEGEVTTCTSTNGRTTCTAVFVNGQLVSSECTRPGRKP